LQSVLSYKLRQRNLSKDRVS